MTDRAKPSENTHTMYDDAPATTSRAWEIITPNDSTNLARDARAFRVGTGGNVYVDDIYGNTNQLIGNMQDGETFPGWVRRIRSTNTTASNIIVYYG